MPKDELLGIINRLEPIKITEKETKRVSSNQKEKQPKKVSTSL